MQAQPNIGLPQAIGSLIEVENSDFGGRIFAESKGFSIESADSVRYLMRRDLPDDFFAHHQCDSFPSRPIRDLQRLSSNFEPRS